MILTPCAAFADTANVSLMLTVEAAPLDFTVNESLSMHATQGQTALTIDSLAVTNTGSEDLKVSSITITPAAGWSVEASSTDFGAAGKTALGFTCNGHDFSGGAYAPGETLAAGSNLSYTLAGQISANADLMSATQVASMVVTVEKAATIISFTIAGTTYQAEEGMTWGEWFKSEYSSSLPQTMTCRDCGAVEYFGEFSSLHYGQTIGWKASLGCDTCILMEGASKAVGINEVIYSENYLFYKHCND